MEYSNLSRETLIHEIKNLNKTIEQLKFKLSRQDSGELSYLEDLPIPVFYIGNEYSILWANGNALETFEKLYDKKCYQAIFNFSDICPNCPYMDVIEYVTPMNVTVSKAEDVWHNMLFPVVKSEHNKGVLEFITPHMEKLQMAEDYKTTISQLSMENQEYRLRLFQVQEEMKHLSRKLLTPIKALQGVYSVLEKSSLTPMQQEYMDVLAENSKMLYELFSRNMLDLEYEEQPLQYQKIEFNMAPLFQKLILRSKGIYKDRELEFIEQDGLKRLVFGDALSFTTALYMLIDAAYAANNSHKLFIHVSEVSETLKQVNLKLTISDRRDENKFKLKPQEVSENEDKIDYENKDVISEYSKILAVKIAKSIISSMNGTFIMSQMDLTGVHITIFISFDKVLPANREAQKSILKGKPKILIIDEERPPVSLDMFDNYDIFFAKTTEQALTLFKTFAPVVTLINIMQMQQDGFKIFDALEKYKTDHQYILSVSNQLIENERDFMKDYGFDDYFAKPLDQETLRQIFTTYAP